MIDGIYQIRFRGAADWGMGLLLFSAGKITGVDIGGVKYDGEYTEEKDSFTTKIKLTVPPGAVLVQGTLPRPVEYSFEFAGAFPLLILQNGEPQLVELPAGPVYVAFGKLRAL